MSIQKIIPNNIGVPAKNWKATSITIDYLNMKAQSTCLGYVNEEAMNDPDARHIDSDTITLNFFWNEDEKNAMKPQKPERIRELEKKTEKTAEEIVELRRLTESYEKMVKIWESEANRQVINDELWQAFQILLKYQYIFHTKGEKLKDGKLLLDTNRQ